MPNIITSGNLTNAIMKFIASQFLPALKANMVMASRINRDYEDVIAAKGDTISVTIAPQMAANNLADGGSVVPQAPNPGNVSVVLNSHIESTFKLTDVAKALASVDAFNLYMQPAIVAAGERVESDILNLYPEFTYNAPLGTPATAPTEVDVDNCEKALFKSRLPAGASKFLVVGADAYSSIRLIPRFTEYQTQGPTTGNGGPPIATGVMGRIKDFEVLRSQLVPATTVGGVTTTHNLAFSRDSITMVMRKLEPPLPGTGAIAEYVEMDGYGFRVLISYDPNTMAQQVSVDCLYGMAVLRNQFAVELQS